MHSQDDIHYALETTKVLREPDRRIDTFGETRFEFLLISELMDRSGEIRIRTGEVEAMRPRILRPSGFREVELDGFDPTARARFDKLVERLKSEGKDLAFLQYGFQFKRGQVHEEIVHDSMDAVRERAPAAGLLGWNDIMQVGGRSGSRSSRRAATPRRSRGATA